ncbi:hypothetical protein TNCV_9181 [Trichonephila clavipes]|nr:hypothetical protein TNCV_9181 [Trichonephila clavipes]
MPVQLEGVPKIRSRGKLHRYNVGAPFERIAFDILGPLPRMSVNKYLLVVMDYFTKWPERTDQPEDGEDEDSGTTQKPQDVNSRKVTRCGSTTRLDAKDFLLSWQSHWGRSLYNFKDNKRRRNPDP